MTMIDFVIGSNKSACTGRSETNFLNSTCFSPDAINSLDNPIIAKIIANSFIFLCIIQLCPPSGFAVRL